MPISDFRKLREKLEAVPLIIPSMMGDAVVEYREEIADLNVEQLEKGESVEETPIRPAYKNPNYARKKQQKNSKPAYGTPDLIATGAYSRSIRVDVYSDGIELRATDKKAGDLSRKYGRVIGLSLLSRNRLKQEILKPYLLRKMRLLL